MATISTYGQDVLYLNRDGRSNILRWDKWVSEGEFMVTVDAPFPRTRATDAAARRAVRDADPNIEFVRIEGAPGMRGEPRGAVNEEGRVVYRIYATYHHPDA